LILVGLSRPEEASEAVPAPTRHNVNVQVGHALTNSVVDGNKGSLSVQSLLDGARQELDIREERGGKLGGQVGQGLIMLFGNQK